MALEERESQESQESLLSQVPVSERLLVSQIDSGRTSWAGADFRVLDPLAVLLPPLFQNALYRLTSGIGGLSRAQYKRKQSRLGK